MAESGSRQERSAPIIARNVPSVYTMIPKHALKILPKASGDRLQRYPASIEIALHAHRAYSKKTLCSKYTVLTQFDLPAA